tara:strand:- start:594 stop:1067 length:474 start_codon:yes stop_codon:yes gene_type:complete
MNRGFTCGAFDLLHAGHILMLEEARSVCDRLIVGLQTDPTIDRPDKNKPIQSLDERKIQLRAVRYVDEIVQYNTEEELYELLQFINPEVRIVGADHRGKDFTGHDLPIKIYFNSRDHQWSTTELRERIYQNELEKATVNKEKQLRESLELLAAYENN